MKKSNELLKGCPKIDKVRVKVKGYRSFVADEVKLRWIALQVAKGKINKSDVFIIEKDGTRLGFESDGYLTRKLNGNTYRCCAELDLELIRIERKKKQEEQP